MAHDFQDWQVFGFDSAPARLFDEIDSTHSLMKEQAKAGKVPPGSLFVANSQSAGRGRHDRNWTSPKGKNLYFNILIPLEGIPSKRFAQITQVAALTFAEVFVSMQNDACQGSDAQGCAGQGANQSDGQGCAGQGAENKGGPNQCADQKITVKWPNDILFGKSKFCGILSEIVYIPASTVHNQLNRNVPALSMGVGINVNSDPEEYQSLGRDVTTLKAILGREVNRELLLKALIGSLERAIKQFKAFGISPWVNAWRKMDKFIGAPGTIVELDQQCKPVRIHGKILDMQEDGSLKFECENGEIKIVYSADLEI